MLLAATVTWCSGRAAVAIESGWFQLDKVAHFAIYGALATAVIRNRWLRERPLAGVIWAVLLTSGYGLGDEFRQSFTAMRTFDLKDWIADTLGAVVAATLYAYWKPYQLLLEMPLRRRRPGVESLPLANLTPAP